MLGRVFSRDFTMPLAWMPRLAGTTVSALSLVMLLQAGPSMAGENSRKGDTADQGRTPLVVDIEALTLGNDHFRAATWTGRQLQMTVMAIPPGAEIGLEVHEQGDQFIRVESGRARVVMGATQDRMTVDQTVTDDWAILIPAGTWHNIINIGDQPLKAYVLYAPPEHPEGTVHRTKQESLEEHGH
jgi:mannose-6-phosphate isomerase-like protein (cupin superfamily)